MSKLINAKISTSIPHVDERLSKYLHFATTCDIPSNLMLLFKDCITAVASQMESEGFFDKPNTVLRIACIASNTDTISIKLDSDELGMCTSIIVYPIHKWNHLNDIGKCLCIIEELCHLLWNIQSEFEVNFKVFEILKTLYSDITMDKIYSPESMAHLAALEGKTYP